MSSEQEETYTYLVKLGVATHFVGSDVKNTVPLEEYGYSDQEWDELSDWERNDLMTEWETEFMHENTETWCEVLRGD